MEGLKKAQRQDSRLKGSADKARVSALKLLSYRVRSEQEIRERLVGKGFNPEVVETVIKALKGSGLINDKETATSFLRIARETKLLGRRGIRDYLFKRGIPHEIVEEVLEDIDEIDSAIKATQKWLRHNSLDDPQAEARLRQYLMRRGYSSDTINEVIKKYHKE